MPVIFDLDLTLVDSSLAAELRSERRWREVYQLIPEFSIYDGVQETLEFLTRHHVEIGIVTSSPESYCSRVLDEFEIPATATVCYHDTRSHKPHPAPILRAVELLSAEPCETPAVGDDPVDIRAARRAGATPVAALWGAVDVSALLAEEPDLSFHHPRDLLSHFQRVEQRL